jgi:hypothetical protein
MCGEHHAPAVFTPGKDLVPIVQEVGWAPEPVWIGAENLASTGIRFDELISGGNTESGSYLRGSLWIFLHTRKIFLSTFTK